MMDYFVVEIKSQQGDGPWLPVNVMKSQGGRAALDLADRIRQARYAEIRQDNHRVRRVSYEEYLDTGTDLANRYHCRDRLDQMENILIGCDALISI